MGFQPQMEMVSLNEVWCMLQTSQTGLMGSSPLCCLSGLCGEEKRLHSSGILLFQSGTQLHGLEFALTSRKQGFVQVLAELAEALKIGKFIIPKLIFNSSGSKATICFLRFFCLCTWAHFPWGRGRGEEWYTQTHLFLVVGHPEAGSLS